MFCPNCGVEAGEAKFCRTCGTNLTIVSDILERDEPGRPRTTALGGRTTLSLFQESRLYNDTDLNGHTAVSTFGGTRIDFTAAPLAHGETKISVVSVFGGAEIFVPDDLAVRVTGVSIFGGVTLRGRSVGGGIFSANHYQTPGYDSAPQRLHIDATSVFGGVEIRRPK